MTGISPLTYVTYCARYLLRFGGLSLSMWGSCEATQEHCSSAQLYCFSNSAPLHLYPGRLLQSYLRNLANMVNRAGKNSKNADSQASGWYLFPVGNSPKYTVWFLYLCCFLLSSALYISEFLSLLQSACLNSWQTKKIIYFQLGIASLHMWLHFREKPADCITAPFSPVISCGCKKHEYLKHKKNYFNCKFSINITDYHLKSLFGLECMNAYVQLCKSCLHIWQFPMDGLELCLCICFRWFVCEQMCMWICRLVADASQHVKMPWVESFQWE